MQLTPVMEKFILHWGEMGSRWGVNRSIAQIHALLFLAGRPMTAEDIAETLSIARSNVSTSLKELQSWDLISMTHVMGDRRDHFEAKANMWDVLLTIVEGRKRREIDPTLTVLRQCKLEADDDAGTPQDVKQRMTDMLSFMEGLSAWYDQMIKLPRPTLAKLLKLGARVAAFVKS